MKRKGHLYTYIHHPSIQQIYFCTSLILTKFCCKVQRKELHQNQHLSTRTTIIVLIIDNREVILGHEMLSDIIYTIYQCIPLFIIMK
jgi:hypothetical protein